MNNNLPSPTAQAESIFDRAGLCSICGVYTSDWVSFDGSVGLCKCRSCLGLPPAVAHRAPRSEVAPQARPRLDDLNSKVTGGVEGRKAGEGAPSIRERFVIQERHCRSRFCPKCAPSYGWRTRERILEAAAAFQHPQILTLTVDRKRFDSPEEAFDYITAGKYLPRLMRLLGVKSWVRVIEFQERTGAGWPHWHVVIDAGRALKPSDLKRAWQYWRDMWGIGGLDLGKRRTKFNDGRHALMYITKYLTKYPRRGFPPWALARQRLRIFDFSKNLREYMRGLEEIDAEEDEDKISRHRAPDRPIVDRMADCGNTSALIRERVNMDTGVVEAEYFGDLPAGREALIFSASTSGLGLQVQIFSEPSEYGGLPFERYYLTGQAGQVVPTVAQVQGFIAFCDSSGLAQFVQEKKVKPARAFYLFQWERHAGLNKESEVDDGIDTVDGCGTGCIGYDGSERVELRASGCAGQR